MRKNLNVNKIVNEMDYLLFIIMKLEWKEKNDYLLELLNKRGKTYLCFYFDPKHRCYSWFDWTRKEVLSFIERRNTGGVNKEKLIKKINNEVLHFKNFDNDYYKVIVEIELFKSICEVERI
jgi:hypothetical protein